MSVRARAREVGRTWPFDLGDLARVLGAWLVLSAAFIAMGWPLRRASDRSGIGRVDRAVTEWFVERRSSTANALTLVGSGLANTSVKVVVTSLIVVAMLWRWRRWYEAAYVALTLVLEACVFVTVTFIVRRPRPDVPRLGASHLTSSFPSGHTAASVAYAAAAVVVFWHTRRALWRAAAVLAAVLMPIVVGVSRVQRGQHHLSDVIAGALLGLVSLAVATSIVVRAQRRAEARSDFPSDKRAIAVA